MITKQAFVNDSMRSGSHEVRPKMTPDLPVLQVPAVLFGLGENPQAGRLVRHQLHRGERPGSAAGLGLCPCQLGPPVQ